MAKRLAAKEAAEQVYERIQSETETWKGRGIQPCVAVLWVEGDPASAYYVLAKQKLAAKLGVAFELCAFPADVSEAAIAGQIRKLNEDDAVHGIMLELPLPNGIEAGPLESLIRQDKDIDGVTPANKLANMTGRAGLFPVTPQACIRLLKHYGYSLAGKNVTLVGRGQTVGLPLFHMLQREQATVTVCHSRTPDIASHLAHAEIAIVAVGRAGMITGEMARSGLVIIDAGINEVEGGRIVGDVLLEDCGHAEAVSPVPGGVGTLTTAILFENVLKAVALQQGEVMP